MSRNEYRTGNLAVRDYKITFLGIPIYIAKFTSTNSDAVRLLTTINKKSTHVCGFTNK